jgi:hypothetical protein
VLLIVSGAVSTIQVFLESIFSCDGNKSVHTRHKDWISLHILGSFGNISVNKS